MHQTYERSDKRVSEETENKTKEWLKNMQKALDDSYSEYRELRKNRAARTAELLRLGKF